MLEIIAKFVFGIQDPDHEILTDPNRLRNRLCPKSDSQTEIDYVPNEKNVPADAGRILRASPYTAGPLLEKRWSCGEEEDATPGPLNSLSHIRFEGGLAEATNQ